MRGAGQIRELARVALPDVGVITNVAPVHLELVGTIEDVAAAKAELIEELTADGTAVVPADEPLLGRHVRRHRGRVVTFGAPDADVHIVDEERRGESTHVLLDAFGHRARLDFSFTGGHYLHRRAGRCGRVRRARVPPGRGRGGSRDKWRSATCAAPSPRFPAAACCSTTPTTPTRSP